MTDRTCKRGAGVHQKVMEPIRKVQTNLWTVVLFVIAGFIVALFLYFDRYNDLSTLFRSWGLFGVLFSIALMTILCVTPIPSEGLLIVLLKVYGLWWGVLYAWTGAVLSSLIVFEIARRFGRPLLRSMITPDRFEQVDDWVGKSGFIGLLIVRLLPIPGFVLSYLIGTIPSIQRITFVLTSAIAIIPYYAGAALVYLGVSRRLVMWMSVGLVALALLWGAGWVFRQRYKHGRGHAGT